MIYNSATPGKYELNKGATTEQIIRPTGLLDPIINVRPIIGNKSQIEDLIEESINVVNRGFRVIVTTLTKKMAEDLSEYLKEKKIRSEYLHSSIKTLERIKILTEFRQGKFDVLVGVNLLREGLDIPEVGFIGVLDADKEGFLRDQRSLIQTMGRAARNVNGHVIMYANRVTGSMENAIKIAENRRRGS